MIILKECYDCGEIFEISEGDVFDGLVARPNDDGTYFKIWLCPTCRKDAEEGGTIAEEDINIVMYDDDDGVIEEDY